MRTFLSSTHRAPLLLAAWGAVAVAVWLIPASIHVVGWEDGTPSRLALVPPMERLLALATLAVLAVLVLTRLSSERLAAVSQVSAPLAVLWLWALPYLPWLSDQLPLLLVLAGPSRWIVVAVALVGCALAAVTGPRAETFQRISLPGHRAVFGITLALLLTVGGYAKYHQGLGGDEPHYRGSGPQAPSKNTKRSVWTV